MKKKLSDVKHGRRNFGIFLLILQVLVITSIIKYSKYDGGFENNIFGLFIQFFTGIFGLYLILIDEKKDIKKISLIYFLLILIFLLAMDIYVNI